MTKKEIQKKIKDFNKHYIPNKLLVGSTSENNLPLLKNRYIENKTLFYVCINNTCQMPTENISECVKLINS